MNKINYFILFIIFFIIFANTSYAAPILRLGNDQTISINFDNRYEQAPSYSDTKTFYIYNDGNTSMTISSVTVSSPGSGISMSIYSSPTSVSAGSYGTVQVSVGVPSTVSKGTYTGIITVNTLSAGSGTMKLTLNVEKQIPAELGSIGSRSTTIKFDRPKGTVPSFPGSIDISLSNIGDTNLYIDSIHTYDPGNGIDFTISDYPSSISEKGSKMITLSITVPSSAREGTFGGKITITTSKPTRYGSKYGIKTDNVDISVTIEHGINMEMTRSSIDFGDTPIYKQNNSDTIISETLGYKPINNIRLNKIEGQDKWLGISPKVISSIEAGSSNTIDIGLLFEGDAALYQKYDWTYTISTNNAGSKSLKITATNVPPDVKPLLDTLCSQKYSHSSTKEIAEKMCSSLKYGDDSARKKTIKLDDLISLIAIANSAVNLLDSYLIAEASINNADYDNAYENILKGVVSARIINAYSEKVSNDKIKNDVTLVNQKSNNLMDGLLEKEKEFYESKKDSKSLQSMTAYERLSEMYGILGNEQERIYFDSKAKEKFEEYNDRVDSAKNSRLEAENISKEVDDSYLSKWGGMHILINPFYHNKVSQKHDLIISKYEEAIQNYDNAGENVMASKTKERLNDINSLFNRIYSMFFVFTGVYTILFIGILSRTTKAMMAYVRDTSETRMGDNFL